MCMYILHYMLINMLVVTTVFRIYYSVTRHMSYVTESKVSLMSTTKAEI